jgi:hypothetical protein
VQKTKFTALWAYPWDLLDEGLHESLGRIASLGFRGISLAISYHAGLLLLPHNPRGHVRFLEDGALYFGATERFRGLAIQPRVSSLVGPDDPLERICTAASAEGLDVVGWTVCTHNSHLGNRHPDMVMRNAWGDPLYYALCPSHPDVQAYLEALVAAASRYPVAALQLESYGFMGFPHGHHHEKINLPLPPETQDLMGICFCPACLDRARAAGVDGESLRQRVAAYLARALDGAPGEPPPDLDAYYAVRDDTVAGLVQRLAQASAAPLNLLGVRPAVLRKATDAIAEVTTTAHHAQAGEVAATVQAARALVGHNRHLAVGLECTPLYSPTRENLAAKIGAAWKAGADSLYCYNYGLMPLRSLEWLRRAL